MAVTKILARHAPVKALIQYALNGDKTNAQVGRDGDSGATFATLNDGYVEVGTGDWVSPPFGIEKPAQLQWAG